MSTTVIGPYEDDDPTEACSTIHHEVIGTTTCLSGGEDVPLAPLTTLKVGGPARHLVIATTHDELLPLSRNGSARSFSLASPVSSDRRPSRTSVRTASKWGSLSRGCVRGTASTTLSALLPLTNVISGIALAVSRLSPIATSSSTSPCNSTSVPALCQSATPN